MTSGKTTDSGPVTTETSSQITGDVIRYIRPSDHDSGVINGSAFDRKPKDIDGVSVTRTGIFDPDEETDIACIRTVVGSCLTLAKNGLFARLSCESIREVGTLVESELDIVSAPTDGLDFDPATHIGTSPETAFANIAHAVISGLPFAGSDNGSLAAELAGDLLCRTITATYST